MKINTENNKSISSHFPRLLGVSLLSALGIFSISCWFVSDPQRASYFDTYIFYHIDEILAFHAIRASVYDPLVFLIPHCKLLPLVIARFFYLIFPFGITSARLMNVFFSTGILYLLWRLACHLGFKNKIAFFVLILTILFPLYFIASFAVIPEILFGFFLLLAIYLFYRERYLLCSIAVSMLPFIRQEGFLYLFCFFVFLLAKRQYRFIPIILIPSFVWLVTSWLLIGYSFFDWFLVIRTEPPRESLMLATHVNRFSFLMFSPLIIMFMIGLWLNSKKKEYFPLLLCIIIQFGIIVLIFIIVLLLSKGVYISYDIRYIVPAVPFISLIAAEPLRRLEGKISGKKTTSFFTYLVFAFLIAASFVYSINSLQVIAKEREVVISESQDKVLKDVGAWLKGYVKKGNYTNIYVFGDWGTDRFIRRLLLGIPPYMNFFTIISDQQYGDPYFGNNKLLNMGSYRFAKNHSLRGISISTCKKGDAGWPVQLKDFNYELIREYPDLPLYFYLIENNSQSK